MKKTNPIELTNEEAGMLFELLRNAQIAFIGLETANSLKKKLLELNKEELWQD